MSKQDLLSLQTCTVDAVMSPRPHHVLVLPASLSLAAAPVLDLDVEGRSPSSTLSPSAFRGSVSVDIQPTTRRQLDDARDFLCSDN